MMHALARLARAAYPPEVRVGKAEGIPHVINRQEVADCNAVLLSCFEDVDAGVEAYCCLKLAILEDRQRECLIFTWRGTDGLKDVTTDAKARMVRTPYGHMHRGFWGHYRAGAEWVSDMHSDHWKPHMVEWANGHSLGGAAAGVCALDWGMHLTTFGSPVLGDKHVTAALSDLPYVYRAWHLGDAVVWTPGAVSNTILRTDYDVGPWKGGGVCVGFGRHAVASYVETFREADE